MLSAVHSAVVPAFEAPDEPGHYAYVQWLVDGRGVPLQGAEPPPLQPEFSQPPLYYLLEAPLAWLAGTEPANLPDWEHQRNPFQNATDFGNVNLYLHLPREAFPWTGALLGLHLMRLANVLFVALMVLATYGCARELGLTKPLAWCAAAVVGLTPQLTFIGGALNADNAVGSLSALSLYLLLRWLVRSASLGVSAWLGVALGGAALSKLSGLVTVGLALAFMALRWLQSRDARALAGLAVTGAATAVVAGWWYVRNWLQLGDPLGWNAMLPATGEMQRTPPLDFGSAALRLLERWYTGLAAFGWTNLGVHWLWYWLGLIAAGWGMIGLVLAAARALRERRVGLPQWLVVVWPLAFIISLVRWVEVNTAADQWRLLFPAYPAVALLLVIGWRRLLFGVWEAVAAAPAGLLALNLGAIALVLVPAYGGPHVHRGPVQHALDVHFGDRLQLVGYDTPQPLDFKRGDAVEVDLFWRVTAALPEDFAIDLATVDSKGKLTWKEPTAPDEGRAPMTAWRPGEIIVDRHRILARPEMVGSQTLLLSVFDPVPPGNHLAASTADGARLANDTATVGRFVVLPARAEPPRVQDNSSFEDHLQLVGHSIVQDRDLLRVTLSWKASAPASKDYTVFLHMLAADGKQVAQSDGQPSGGAFPTSLLGAGVEVPDLHVLDVSQVPPGDYRLEVGLYELSSGARLPTVRGEGSVSLPVRIS